MKYPPTLHLLIPLTLILTGCNLTRMLKPVVDTTTQHVLEATITAGTPTKSTPALAIARPSLPRYLDRRQIVDRDQNGDIRINNYDLWSESLDAGIARVIGRNLRAITGSTNIQSIDDFITLEYTGIVEIKFAQFDTGSPNELILECTWAIYDLQGEILQSNAFRTAIPISDASDEKQRLRSHVNAMNEGLARLARDISTKL